MSDGGTVGLLSSHWKDLIGLLAQEVVFGPDHTPSIIEVQDSPELGDVRERLVSEARTAVAGGEPAGAAFLRIRERELPNWSSPLLAVSDEERASHNPRNPWRLRPGWADEPLIPGNPDRKGRKGRKVGSEQVEPGYEEYNRLVGELFFRPFRTSAGAPRCAIPTSLGLEVRDPTDPGFIDSIGYRDYTLAGEPVPSAELRVAAKAIEQRALARDLPQERVVELEIRFARISKTESLLDLADARHRCVRITPTGWAVEQIGHPRFDTPPNLRELPEPIPAQPGEDGCTRVQELWRYVALAPESADGNPRLLAVTQLVHRLLEPSSPAGISIILGGEGDGKTATAAWLQEVIDPASIPYVGAPKDEDKLAELAYNRATINLDNLSHVPLWLSDALCRMSTGAGIAKRELYTNRGEIAVRRYYWFILNGITAQPQLADLIRRCIFFTITPPAVRADPSELASSFREAHPRILGGLLDLAVRARAILGGRTPPNGSDDSMAGFVRVGRAVALALGGKAGDFDQAWRSNLEKRDSAASENPWVGVLYGTFDALTPGALVSSADLAKRITEAHRETFPKGVDARLVGMEIARSLRTLERMGVSIGKRKSRGVPLYFRKEKEHVSPVSPIDSFAEVNNGGRPGGRPEGDPTTASPKLEGDQLRVSPFAGAPIPSAALTAVPSSGETGETGEANPRPFGSSTQDPEDLFGGRPTRADRARRSQAASRTEVGAPESADRV